MPFANVLLSSGHRMRGSVLLILLLKLIVTVYCTATNSPPVIGTINISPTFDSDGAFTLRILDAESDFVSLSFEIAIDDGPFRSARVFHDTGAVSAGSIGAFALSGLPSSPTGIEHSFVWDARADSGFRASFLVLRATPYDAAAGLPSTVPIQLPTSKLRQQAIMSAPYYMLDFGLYDAQTLAVAQTYPIVILNPSHPNITRDLVATLKLGVDLNDPSDDVLVLGMISIGEDYRTIGISDQQLQNDARFRGNLQGPRLDPRAADDHSLDGLLSPLGAPSPTTGYASYYLDDANSNGVPDRDLVTTAALVNGGDPAWFDVLQAMTVQDDGVAGLQEILMASFGRGLVCDGVAMINMNIAAPQSYSVSGFAPLYDWTAPGLQSLVHLIRTAYPSAVLLQKDGLFYFDPQYPHYRYSTRSDVDIVLFDSFYADSNGSNTRTITNQYHVAPKVIAESSRSDGFKALALSYPPPFVTFDTLSGVSAQGLPELMNDVSATLASGFRTYISTPTLTEANTFVRDHSNATDLSAPVWSSTYNNNGNAAATPRIGVQEAVSNGMGGITVRWDVALDASRVRYVAYYQTVPFSFISDPTLSRATQVSLTPRVSQRYVNEGAAVGVYPFEDTFVPSQGNGTFYILIRAVDGSPNANQDDNQAVVTVLVVPDLQSAARRSSTMQLYISLLIGTLVCAVLTVTVT